MSIPAVPALQMNATIIRSPLTDTSISRFEGDAVVIAALRTKMIRVVEQHWTVGAVRRTAVPFVTVALVFSMAGGIIHQVRPDARSIGGVFHAERTAR